MNSNMHIENMENLLDKLNMYKKNELMLFGELKNEFNNIGYIFELPFSKVFEEKINQLYDNLSIIIKVHENNIIVINRNIDKYLNTSFKVAQKFDEIVK